MSDKEYEKFLCMAMGTANRQELEAHLIGLFQTLVTNGVSPEDALDVTKLEFDLLCEAHQGSDSFSLKFPPQRESLRKWLEDGRLAPEFSPEEVREKFPKGYLQEFIAQRAKPLQRADGTVPSDAVERLANELIQTGYPATSNLQSSIRMTLTRLGLTRERAQ
ncbi:MAG: hypothetical protein WBD30_15430 [Bacteroidota bacterium]